MKNSIFEKLRRNLVFTILSAFILLACDTSGNDPLPEDPLEETDPNEFIPLHRMDILDNGSNGKNFEVNFFPIDGEKHKPKKFLSSTNGEFSIVFKNRVAADFGERYVGTYTDAYDFEENKIDSILVVNDEGDLIFGYIGTGGTKNNMPNGINITKTPDAIQKMLQFKYSRLN